MNLVKLGGSVITVKEAREPRPRRDLLGALAADLAAAGAPTVVVHGAGSYGHPLAKEHNLMAGADGSVAQRAGAAATMAQVRELNRLVCDALRWEGFTPAVLFPSSAMFCDDGALAEWPVTIFREWLALGLTPVTCGDVVLDRARGFTILSGDALMVALARTLAPARALFVLDQPGVWDRFDEPDARVLPELDAAGVAARLRAALAEAGVTDPADPWAELDALQQSGADVTGGLWGKLRAGFSIAPHCECRIVGTDDLRGALAGEAMGTLLVT